jgi:transposase
MDKFSATDFAPGSEDFQKAVRLLVDCGNNIATCHAMQNDTSKARQAAYSVLALDENNVKALVRVGQTCVTLDDFDEATKRLQQIPGIGPITASALAASVGDARQFEDGRQMSAWMGLVPRQHSSGGKSVLLGITKRGDKYLRTLLIHGARAALKAYQRNPAKMPEHLAQLLQRKHPNVVCVALASRNARVAWAMLSRREDYRGRDTLKLPSLPAAMA